LATPLGRTVTGQIAMGDTNSSDGVYVDYEIVGQDTDGDTVYDGTSNLRSVPVMGRGTAGYGCDVMSLDVLAADRNHPCNWNKIYYGESVDIPLYVLKYEDKKILNVNNFFDTESKYFSGPGLDMSALDIYVRSACVNAADCDAGRYDILKFGEGLGDLIVAWQVTGQCYHGEAIGMLPCGFYQVFDTATGSFQEQHFDDGIAVVQLFESSTAAIDFEDQAGVSPDFLLALPGAPWEDLELNKPVLKLSFITEALSDTVSGGGSSPATPVPYLEYHISYKSDEPLAAAYSIFVDGYSDKFRYSMSGVQNMNSGLFDFAVQN